MEKEKPVSRYATTSFVGDTKRQLFLLLHRSVYLGSGLSTQILWMDKEWRRLVAAVTSRSGGMSTNGGILCGSTWCPLACYIQDKSALITSELIKSGHEIRQTLNSVSCGSVIHPSGIVKLLDQWDGKIGSQWCFFLFVLAINLSSDW